MPHNSPPKIKILFHIFLIILIFDFSFFICLKSTGAILQVEYIQNDKKISQCEERKLNDKILFITSRYCSVCKEAKSRLMPLITKYNLETHFQIFDIINKEDFAMLNSLAINVSHTPVLIINCNAYLGLKNKDQYTELLAKYEYGVKSLQQTTRCR